MYHILNGDCLAEKFPVEIAGERLVWREAFVDGPLSEQNFFEDREKFIRENWSAEGDYQKMVIEEFRKIKDISEGSEVYFWFEDDLFCQINYWFLVNELADRNIELFRIFPTESKSGFGQSNTEVLLHCFQRPVKISNMEKAKITKLWKSYQLNKNFPVADMETVRNLHQLAEANAKRFNGQLLSQLKTLKNST